MRRLLFAFTLLAVMAGPAHALFSVLGLKNSMVQFLLDQISTEGVFEVTADTVEEPEDGVTAIRGLRIADADGVWFIAESLRFAWNPERLLRGEVEFADLTMRDVTVLRQPATAVAPAETDEPDDAPAEPFAWPRSPLTLRVDRMALERVSIAEPVLGHAIAFDADGAVRDEGDIQALRLDLTRTDTVAGQISLAYERNFADNTLKLDLDADEGPQGLISALSGLPPDAASRVTLKADGPPTDWKAKLDLDLAETLSAEGTAQISYEGPIRVDADIVARPGARLPADLAAIIGAEAQLRARAAEGPDGVILIEEGRFSSPDLNLRAAGTYARPTGAADLDVSLSANAGLAAPFDGVAFERAEFEGTLTGAPGSFQAAGRLSLAGLATSPVDVAAAQLDLTLGQSGPSDRVTTAVTVSGDTTGLRLDRVSAQTIGPAGLVLRGALTGDALSLETVSLDSGVLKVGAAGTADLGTGDADLTVDVATARLAEVAASYGVDAGGRLTADGVLSRRAGVADADLTIAIDDLRHPQVEARTLEVIATARNDGARTDFGVTGVGTELRLDRLEPDVIGTADLDIAGRVDGAELTLDHARLNSALMQVLVNGTLDQETGAGSFAYGLTIPDLAPAAGQYDLPLAGGLRASGEATLGDDAPRIDGHARLGGLVWQGQRYGDFTLLHDISVGDAVAGRLDATLRRGIYGDVALGTDLAFAAPELTLGGLDLRALGLRARGDLAVDIERTLAEGTVRLTSPNIAPLSRLAGTALSGDLDGTVTLARGGGRQDLVARLTGRRLTGGTARIGALTLDAALSDLLGTPQVRARLDTRETRAGPLRLDTASVRADGPLSRLAVEARTGGMLDDRELSVLARLAADLDGAVQTVRISTFEAQLDEHRTALATPLTVTARGQTVEARGLDLLVPGDGRISGDLARRGQALVARLRASLPDLAVLGDLAGAPVTAGRADLTADIDTGRARGVAEVRIDGLRISDIAAAGALGIDANADWQGRQARIESTVAGNFGDPVRLSATVPVARGAIPSLARRGPVTGRVDWRGRLDDLWALVPAAGHILSGEAEIGLGITGDISAPDLTGGVTIREGGYQNLDLGTILTDLELTTTLAGGGALDFALDARDGATGRVRTEGRVALDASGIDIKTTIENAILVRRDDARARLGGEITISGPAQALDVTGQIDINTAEVRLVNANPPSVPDLGEIEIKGAPPETDDTGESSVDLDLRIRAPGRVFVRGRGLDSEWRTDLAITGTAASPQIRGRIERVRGRLDLIGKGFDLETGRIIFDGGRKIDPRLDLMFERETTDLTGRIVISGSASEPELTFRSTPALPEDEVLPRTLFGKSSQALTASQGIQLALGLATLMDGGGGTLDAVRGAAGLDTLRLEQDESGNTSVTAGKEVAEGIWVGTKQGVGGGGTSVLVEIDVLDNVTIDAEAGAEKGSSVGLKWKKDF